MKEFNMRVIPHNDDLELLVEYSEDLLGFLEDHVPCLDELITIFDESYGRNDEI